MALLSFGYVAPPFGELWPIIKPILAQAVERSGDDWREIGQSLGDGRAQLWLGMEDNKPVFAGISRRFDDGTIEIWFAGGRILAGGLHCLETVLAAARQDGATEARMTGRKGWARVLKDYGWRQDGDELVKELT